MRGPPGPVGFCPGQGRGKVQVRDGPQERFPRSGLSAQILALGNSFSHWGDPRTELWDHELKASPLTRGLRHSLAEPALQTADQAGQDVRHHLLQVRTLVSVPSPSSAHTFVCIHACVSCVCVLFLLLIIVVTVKYNLHASTTSQALHLAL